MRKKLKKRSKVNLGFFGKLFVFFFFSFQGLLFMSFKIFPEHECRQFQKVASIRLARVFPLKLFEGSIGFSCVPSSSFT